jgi:hypothetical protein
MDNPKVAKDIVKNPNTVYGYSPNPKSERIGKYADYVKDGYFHESELISAPAFDLRINGITEKTKK